MLLPSLTTATIKEHPIRFKQGLATGREEMKQRLAGYSQQAQILFRACTTSEIVIWANTLAVQLGLSSLILNLCKYTKQGLKIERS